MKKVAVFGNAGGGKSTRAQKLSALTKLPLYSVDQMQFRAGGGEVLHDEYVKAHADLLRREAWIIDGFGSRSTAWERFACADTLIYIDLSLSTHFAWVTKRLCQGVVATPKGWPEGSPMIRSTISSYRVLWLCHRHSTPRYRALVAENQGSERVHHLQTPRTINEFLAAVGREVENG